MNHWLWPVSLVGILSTAVVCGTDMFFLTIGHPALRLASPSAGTEVMGFRHMFAECADADLGRLGDLLQLLAGRRFTTHSQSAAVDACCRRSVLPSPGDRLSFCPLRIDNRRVADSSPAGPGR
jgi:hypothetical protein